MKRNNELSQYQTPTGEWFGWLMKAGSVDRWATRGVTTWPPDAKEIAAKKAAYQTMTLNERINWRGQ